MLTAESTAASSDSDSERARTFQPDQPDHREGMESTADDVQRLDMSHSKLIETGVGFD